jgi:hypothetical protein
MHRVLPAFLLVAAAAACAPTAPPRATASPALAPLGPCPAAAWKPEAPPPTSSEKTSMVLLAVAEWFRFGQQTIDFREPGPVRLMRAGVPEGEAFASERVRDYWKSVDRPEVSGLDHGIPWSAAFISWDVESAGVPRDQFCPSARHTIYIERLADRAARPGATLIPRRLDERRPQAGDLICASRDAGKTTLDHLDRGPGHCDIVVEVRPGEVQAIGGNVHDSVSRSVFPLDANGFLSPIAGHPFFTVIENRLP